MASSLRLYSSSSIPHKLALKSNHVPSFLILSRHFCSKDSDVTAGSSDANDSSKEKQENVEKTPLKLKSSRFKSTPVTNEMKEAAKQKLKSLLSEITVTSDNSGKTMAKLQLAKAVKRISSKRERLREMEAKLITPQKEMDMAVKAAASSFKDSAEKVESELTEKLITLNLSKRRSTEEVQDTKETPTIEEEINNNLMSSVEEVAATISENPIPNRSELTKRLMKLSRDQKGKSDKTMRSVIKGMVIKSQRSAPARQTPFAERDQVAQEDRQKMSFERRMAVKKSPVSTLKIEKVDLFGAAPLNIFSPSDEVKPDSSNAFWRKLQERELRLLTQFAPANAFEEMILWTEQGKHWKLPVDNETEMGEEENVGFHEHVFLEKHLKGFPTTGPVRHFMELVCVGLSKNPYITVERKIENIEWFRNYFKEKEEVLRDAGAIE